MTGDGPLDILFVRNLFRPADFGGNRYPWEVTRRLAERHRVRVITPRPGGPLPGATAATLHTYPVSRRTPFETFVTNAAFSRVAVEREIARRRPDVIVMSSYDTAYGYLIAPHKRLPSCYIYHSSFYSPAVDRVGRRPIPVRWAHGPLARFLRHVERTVFRGVNAIVAVSPFSKREISERLGHDDPRIVVIPTGVDAATFSPGSRADARSRLGIDDGARLLVTAGRLAPVKRYDRAIDVVGLLGRIDDRYRLLVVGDGPERARLEAHARTTGTGERVRFAGHLDGADLVASYRAADAVLCTSDFENWSLALLEAQACGAIVVGTPRGSIPEMVGDPRLVARETAPEAIAETVGRVLEGPREEADAMRRAARERVASRFSWESTVEGLEATLRAIVGGGRPAG